MRGTVTTGHAVDMCAYLNASMSRCHKESTYRVSVTLHRDMSITTTTGVKGLMIDRLKTSNRNCLISGWPAISVRQLAVPPSFGAG